MGQLQQKTERHSVKWSILAKVELEMTDTVKVVARNQRTKQRDNKSKSSESQTGRHESQLLKTFTQVRVTSVSIKSGGTKPFNYTTRQPTSKDYGWNRNPPSCQKIVSASAWGLGIVWSFARVGKATDLKQAAKFSQRLLEVAFGLTSLDV